MGSRNNKNNKNKVKQQKQQQKVQVQPTKILSNEETERIISEAKEQASKIIAEANEEANKIIDEARENAKGMKDEVFEEFKDEARTIVSAEYDQLKETLKKANSEQEAAFETKEKELNEKREQLTETINDYDSKFAQLLVDQQKLEGDKVTYKTEVLKQIKEGSEDVSTKFDELQTKYNEKERELKIAQKEVEEYNEYKTFFDQKMKELNEEKFANKQLKSEKDALEYECTQFNDVIKGQNEKISSLNLSLSLYGEDPTSFVKDKERLEQENEELRSQLAILPSEEEYKNLVNHCEDYDQIVQDNRDLHDENMANLVKLKELDAFSNDIYNYKKIIRVLELQREELQKEIGRLEEFNESKSRKVFAALSDIDNKEFGETYPETNISLKDLCEDFRLYLANGYDEHLYYSLQDIRTFIAGLAASRFIIIQGMSGTGKSSLPKAFATYTSSNNHLINVQSSWRDKNDLIGFYNDFEKRFKETDFLKALYTANVDRGNIHTILLDEMNLSRVEYYFTDFNNVLQNTVKGDRLISLIEDKVEGEMPKNVIDNKLLITDNTWFIGTANKDDSTQPITDKIYDRAIILNLNARFGSFETTRHNKIQLSAPELIRLLEDAKDSLTTKERDLLDRGISMLDKDMCDMFKIKFGNRIGKQIMDFAAAYKKCGGEVEKALDIMFASKVIRKLEYKCDQQTKENIKAFESKLIEDDKYKDYDMDLTIEALDDIAANMY